MKYDKLVRDNIPYIINKDGEIAFTKVLNNSEFTYYLEKELLEVSNGLRHASVDNKINQLADIYEILITYAKYYGYNLEDLLEAVHTKREYEGNFNKKLLLIKTEKK